MQIRSSLMLAFALACIAGLASAQDDPRRFRLIPFTEMTPAQKAYADAVMAGPTSSTGSAAVVPGSATIGAPFNVYLRSPDLAMAVKNVGEYIRFKTSLPLKLNELAILVTARHYTAQYEWFAHHRLALKEGLDPKIAEELAQGRRPTGMSNDEALVHDFSKALHADRGTVDDALFKAMRDRFGEQGVVDLIAVNGYYAFVSMILNVDRTPVPGGKSPLPVLK